MDEWKDIWIDGWMVICDDAYFSQFLFYSSTQQGHIITCFCNHVPTLVHCKEAVVLV